MLPGHVVEEYLKAYREYIMREVEKSRKLKILDQTKSKNPALTSDKSAGFASAAFWNKLWHQVSPWRARYRQQAQPLRLVEALLSLFRPRPPCENC